MRRLILVFGAIGLLGCFLPMHDDDDDAPGTVHAVIGAYAVATLIGLAGRRITRTLAAVAAFGSSNGRSQHDDELEGGAALAVVGDGGSPWQRIHA